MLFVEATMSDGTKKMDTFLDEYLNQLANLMQWLLSIQKRVYSVQFFFSVFTSFISLNLRFFDSNQYF